LSLIKSEIQLIILIQMTSTSDNAESSKEVYRTIFGAEVLWPLDCPDDILEAVLKEIKKQET
jgi:hypothetical protein